MNQKVVCHACGADNDFIDRLSLKAECEKCSDDLHCCHNCLFYDQGSYNECKESSAGVVRDKLRANHCDYFKVGLGAFVKDEKEELLSAAEALFKK